MIIDTSAIVSILRKEPETEAFVRALRDARVRRLSAASYLETGVVIDSARDPVLSARLDQLLNRIKAVIEPVTPEQAKIARAAYRDFGRGSGHPAKLNFGDCFAYALAKAMGEPLLYKGDDFSHTDVAAAL